MRIEPAGPERTLGVAAICVVLLALALYLATRAPGTERAGELPSLAELDSLARYVRPSTPGTPFEEYDAYLPATPPPPVPLPEVVEEVEPVDPGRWRLSAILIAGGRPLAIINDRQVRTGERLDGAEVVAIERDRVVLRQRDGTRHTLRLNDAFERTL